jgi:hypothetical protein
LIRRIIAANGSRLGDVAEIEAQKLSFAQKFNRRPELEFSTSAAILPNRCCMPFFFMVSSLSVDLGRYQNYFCFGLFRLLCE